MIIVVSIRIHRHRLVAIARVLEPTQVNTPGAARRPLPTIPIPAPVVIIIVIVIVVVRHEVHHGHPRLLPGLWRLPRPLPTRTLPTLLIHDSEALLRPLLPIFSPLCSLLVLLLKKPLHERLARPRPRPRPPSGSSSSSSSIPLAIRSRCHLSQAPLVVIHPLLRRLDLRPTHIPPSRIVTGPFLRLRLRLRPCLFLPIVKPNRILPVHVLLLVHSRLPGRGFPGLPTTAFARRLCLCLRLFGNLPQHPQISTLFRQLTPQRRPLPRRPIQRPDRLLQRIPKRHRGSVDVDVDVYPPLLLPVCPIFIGVIPIIIIISFFPRHHMIFRQRHVQERKPPPVPYAHPLPV